jgi:hypothetical protein
MLVFINNLLVLNYTGMLYNLSKQDFINFFMITLFFKVIMTFTTN